MACDAGQTSVAPLLYERRWYKNSVGRSFDGARVVGRGVRVATAQLGGNMTSIRFEILGHTVLRLEDPTLLTGAGKYLDNLVQPGHAAASRIRALDGRPRRRAGRRRRCFPRRCQRIEPSSTPATTSGCRRCLQECFTMMCDLAQSPRCSAPTGSGSSATSSPPSVAESKAGEAIDTAEAVLATSNRCRSGDDPSRGAPAGCDAPVSRTRVERLLRDEPRR